MKFYYLSNQIELSVKRVAHVEFSSLIIVISGSLISLSTPNINLGDSFLFFTHNCLSLGLSSSGILCFHSCINVGFNCRCLLCLLNCRSSRCRSSLCSPLCCSSFSFSCSSSFCFSYSCQLSLLNLILRFS